MQILESTAIPGPEAKTPVQLRQGREQLVAIIQELQANAVILDGLLNSYRVFRFTGGHVSREPWDLVALTSYLQHPFAADRISFTSTERYRHLADVIMDSGKAIETGARPRSLRSRHDIAAQFDRDATEIRALGSTLESAMTKLVDER
jgi:hypothetical protein